MARKPKEITNIKELKGRDPDLEELLDLLNSGDHVIREISRRCGVAVSTIQNWRTGKTLRPSNTTIRFVLRAMGYRRRIEKL